MTRFEPVPILKVLTQYRVRFVLIGGMAGSAHGSPSITNDVDVCYDRHPDNLDRLAAALVDMEARLRGVTDDVPFVLDAQTLANGDHFTFETVFGPLDCLGTPAGSAGYASLKANATTVDVGVPVDIASLDDLMAMKRAAGRPKDRIELEILGALRDELEGD